MLNTLKKISKILNFYKKQLSKIVVFCSLVCAPYLLYAQIEMTEIMYDLEIGSDAGREWIEIYNSGTEDIDIGELKLYEAEINHKIKPIIEGGNTILAGGDYAILLDNYEKFKEDYPNFSGLVLDTVFSLKNTGELLILRDSELVDINSVNYLSDWGAGGDGKSLQKINNAWIASFPTLGKSNSSDNNSVDPITEVPIINPSPQASSFDFIEINIKAKIDSLEYLPIAGADVVFKGKALGLEGEFLENASYQWSFGDGTKGNGQTILHNYPYPGEYLVIMEVISGEYSTCDKLKVKVIPSEMFISSVNLSLDNNFIELHNPSGYEVNLSWWRLRADNNFFTFPKNTILLPKAYIKLPFSVTKLLPKENSVIQLLYPNGMLTFNYLFKQNIVPVVYTEGPKIVTERKKDSTIYSVEKPAEEYIENQVALIKDSLGERGNSEDEDSKKFKFPINKWSFALGGITLVAVAGVTYATKLDSEN
ncbi:MAG: PKD domain-containing protein [Candidatus Pacebacteria bacterium]|nr:PKD domain-containing protein [Candidatus Paceibacterota bacterium]